MPDSANPIYTTTFEESRIVRGRSRSEPALLTTQPPDPTDSTITMTAIEGDPPAAAAQADGTSQQYVSGGTRSELTGDAKLRFTNSMMQAYIAMRGPAMGEGSDPLFEWIKSRDTRPGNDQSALAQGEKKDALRYVI